MIHKTGEHMKLSDMQRSGDATARYTMPVADTLDAKDFDLTITGPRKMVENVFADSEFEIVIDPAASREDMERRTKETLKKYLSKLAEAPAAEDVESLAKRMPKSATGENSVVVTLRRLRGEGTAYYIIFPMVLGRGQNLYFVMPPALITSGAVIPVNGDPDLFLTLNGVAGAPVASSMLAGGAADTISFGKFDLFIPFYRVFGYTPTTFIVSLGTWSPNPFF
jgi:hypothetical protein